MLKQPTQEHSETTAFIHLQQSFRFLWERAHVLIPGFHRLKTSVTTGLVIGTLGARHWADALRGVQGVGRVGIWMKSYLRR